MIKRKKLSILSTSIMFLFAFAAVALAASVTGLTPVGDGVSTDWTPSTGTDHFAVVDEATCNGTDDYNYTETIGDTDSYVIDLSSVPDGATVTGIFITPCGSKHKKGGPTSQMSVLYRWDGVNSNEGIYFMTSNSNVPSTMITAPFTGLSLVKQATSTLEVDFTNRAGRKGLRLSRVGVDIEYTTP
jgi:hypothetical protein